MNTALAPGFVVATPSLRDPNFARTVVLLVEHGESGSLGFVVNRPSALSFGQVLESLGFERGHAHGEMPVLAGGPVSLQSGWLIFDPRNVDEEDLEDALIVNEGLAVSASRKLLERIARTAVPPRCILALGYAGWSEGQLDAEFGSGAWMPADFDPGVLFEVEPDARWGRALAHAGIEPGRIMRSGGDVC